MRKSLLCALCFLNMASFAMAGESNLFNPYLNATLPSAQLQGENAKMAKSLGAKASNLQAEVHHRKFWRQEVYPVVFGNPQAPHEVLVFLDYAIPQSLNLWMQVVQATQRMNAQQTKVVVFSKNSEPYGTELMGGGIWLTIAQPTTALNYYTYTLQRWNSIKQTLKSQGIVRSFVHEYDATAGPELPILYAYLDGIKHLIPSEQHFDIVNYAFDAGNINMYQAALAAQEYNVHHFPAVVVDGELLQNVSAQKILDALQ